jgi:hypothetical protein
MVHRQLRVRNKKPASREAGSYYGRWSMVDGLVPVHIALERTVLGNTQVLGLLGGELVQLHADLGEVQPWLLSHPGAWAVRILCSRICRCWSKARSAPVSG